MNKSIVSRLPYSLTIFNMFETVPNYKDPSSEQPYKPH